MPFSDAETDFEVDPRRAKLPQRTRLSGRLVSVVPLEADTHSQALYAASHDTDHQKLWRYMSEGPFPDYESFHAAMIRKQSSPDPLFYTIVDNASGDPRGYAAFLRFEPAHRSIEVGSILLTPRLQQTSGATEAMYLMAGYVFEELGYRRYEWKCHALNEASRRAALRLGFTYEGIFRRHMIVKGRNRDTAWFSMLDSEWPVRKANFQRWLDPSNFDADGRQKSSLSILNCQSGGEGLSEHEGNGNLVS